MAGLYIHVPFCRAKCAYCDFYSVALPPGSSQPAVYLATLARDLRALPRRFAPGTIYLGGGTPTVFAPPELEQLLRLVREAVPVARVKEWTCEANPGTLDAHRAAQLRQAGVNRISLGVQSLDPNNLRCLGRIHSADEACGTLALLRAAGFDNIGLDFMYAIPGASRHSLEHDLAAVVELRPEHVSWYALTLEEHTPLARRVAARELRPVADGEARRQYDRVRRVLREAGYLHYEISNFCRPGRACRHNLLYWTGGRYLGCGPAAHSHWRGARWGQCADLERYAAAWAAGRPPRETVERLAPEARARELLVMSLRRLDGVGAAWFRRRTGFDYRALGGAPLARLCRDGWLVEQGGKLRLAEKSLFVSNSILAELI